MNMSHLFANDSLESNGSWKNTGTLGTGLSYLGWKETDSKQSSLFIYQNCHSDMSLYTDKIHTVHALTYAYNPPSQTIHTHTPPSHRHIQLCIHTSTNSYVFVHPPIWSWWTNTHTHTHTHTHRGLCNDIFIHTHTHTHTHYHYDPSTKLKPVPRLISVLKLLLLLTLTESIALRRYQFYIQYQILNVFNVHLTIQSFNAE